MLKNFGAIIFHYYSFEYISLLSQLYGSSLVANRKEKLEYSSIDFPVAQTPAAVCIQLGQSLHEVILSTGRLHNRIAIKRIELKFMVAHVRQQYV